MRGYEQPDLVALDEIEDLLEAYAEARLSPSGPVLARIRRNVLTQAASVAAARAVERRAHDTDLARARRRARIRTPSWPRALRPLAALAMAVMVGAGTGAVVLAAPAGSPFFNARVALEQLFLPTQIDDRLASHEQHLLARLAEAEAAAARGDATALAAVLAAYDTEVAQALGELGDDADLLAHLEVTLAKHVETLTALQAMVPEQASIDKALDNSQKAIATINEKKQDGSRSQGGRPGSAPGGPPDERQGGGRP